MRTSLRFGALVLGVVLFAITLAYVDLDAARSTTARLGAALPIAIGFSAVWQLARTIAWAWCFPRSSAIGFARLARVRLAAEAFSYLTLRGIAGEPLKVMLLAGRVDARQATAAVALERIAYIVGTTIIVGVASVAAIVWLPLSDVWFRVFRAFAIGSAAIAVLTAIVVSGRGTYLAAVLRAIDRLANTSWSSGRVAAFLGAVERQMLELVRGNPARLAVLVLMTIVAYVSMSLEAWIVLRATGLSVSAAGATTVETFSRVASFASAFIPANLGALEASSVAAASAAGVAGGGAALAIARRMRGLFWAAIGLALYPWKERVEATGWPASGRLGHTLLYFPEDPAVDVPATARLAGLAIAERVLRAASRAGYSRILIWLPARDTAANALETLARRAHGAEIVRTREGWQAALARIPGLTPVTALGSGTVVSPALLEDATLTTAGAGQNVDVPAGAEWPESGVIRLLAADAAVPEQVADALAIRRARALPLPDGRSVAHGHARLALRISSAADLEQAEHTIRRSSYKDTDSKLARFNRRMSLPISVALIRTPLTANQLSIVLVAVGFYAAWLFSAGHYWTGVTAAFLSLSASILDGCDGEIARLKYQESALGCWIETVGDYSYYVAIFIGLTAGAVRQTHWEAFYWIGGIALAGTLVAFALLIFLRSRITAGRPERLHAIARQRFKAEPKLWSRVIWRISFVATRAAMPYGIMAFALVKLLPAVVLLAAIGANVYWISMVARLRDLLGGGQQERVAA